MAAWRLATPLTELRAEVDHAFPKRSKRSDGTLGDARHKKTKSRHNISGGDTKRDNVVEAIDLTHDPKNGYDAHAHARRVAANPPACIANIISNRQIWSPGKGWRRYIGINGHTKHAHYDTKNGYESASNYNWSIGVHSVPVKNASALSDLGRVQKDIAIAKRQVLRQGSRGTAVIWLQIGLNKLTGTHLTTDGNFGSTTDQAVRNLQRFVGMPVDGVVGPRTWALLFK